MFMYFDSYINTFSLVFARMYMNQTLTCGTLLTSDKVRLKNNRVP